MCFEESTCLVSCSLSMNTLKKKRNYNFFSKLALVAGRERYMNSAWNT